MAINDIYLYQGESNPNDIILGDPTVLRSGTVYFGILKRWTGLAWVKAKLQYYNGASWVSKPLKRWTGTEWKLVDTTGV